jgi:Spy/CpxP family protein refolding chaperone
MEDATMKKTILTTTLVLALALIAYPALAQNQGGCPGPGCGHGHGYAMGPGMGPGMFDGSGFLHRLHRLDLSDEQHDQIQALIDQFQPQFEDLQGQIQDYVTELHGELQASGYNEALLRPVVEAKAGVGVELELLRMNFHSQVAGILTPEQLETLQQMRGPRGRRGFDGGKGQRPGGGNR